MHGFQNWFMDKYLDWQKSEGERKTITDFAKFLDIPRPILSHYMNGRNSPSGENVEKIAEKFGPEVYDVLGLARPLDPQLQELQRAYDAVPPEKREELLRVVEEYLRNIGARQ